jgi:hypothetical protein
MRVAMYEVCLIAVRCFRRSVHVLDLNEMMV